ncbi:MAG: flagellar biosynthesis protein FlhF [Gallionella sp.]|nr:flagellar biosynthesis protein FlhF [Gallionella sp.]MDP1940893.1 flagellar biosynthesis protein FlhF [Gallionella sp.]
MKIRKFIATTAREALREIRSELGEDAVILSNRKTEQGVEIVAMANDEMVRLSGDEMVRLSGTIKQGQKLKAKEQESAKAEKAAAEVVIAAVPAPAVTTAEASILGEIKSMHSMLQKQIETLSWNNVQQRDPQRAGLLRRMLNSGFSTLLARQLLNKMPDGNERGEAWIKQVLKRNLRVAAEEDDIVVKGGVYALIGPTGVGKTTTTAKLAARAVVRYGADKVALLTTDSYRIGAYEQLKIYGKILGVAVHAVKGADDLRLTLSALRHKHLVLIDTVGMGQRDERVSEQSDMFDATSVQRLLVLNSTSSGDTLEDVVRMYYSNKVIGCIATKLDEAVNLGALLDVVMRHRMVMYFMANGQRVPEDLHPVNIDVLLHRAFKAVEEKTPFTLEELEFPMIMAGAVESSTSEVSYAL